MAINDISLTSGMRSNLVNLQGTVSLLNRTQQRLSSGKRVNSALDDPTNFFAAEALNQRASDLSKLKDSMGQGIQTIQAANNGITGISSLIEAAKGIAQSALGTSDTTSRASYGQQFDDLVQQIKDLATDSGYKGTNLLSGGTLAVSFNETGSSSISVSGQDLTTNTTGFTFTASSATTWASSTIATGTTAINTSVTELNTATTTLRNVSAGLSSNLDVITARQDFTTNMVNTLTTGSDNLTLADMNEEGANMLMLQTRQALGTTALSLSAQAAQSVLKLF